MEIGPKRNKAGRALLVVYAALIGIALLLERPNDVTEFVYHLFSKTGESCRGREEKIPPLAAYFYNLMADRFASPGELRVRVVTLERGSEPADIFGDENLCRQRLFVARLVQRLQQLNARSIVIDKYFNRDTCDKSPKGPRNGSDELRDAVGESSIPITVGLHTDDVGGLAGESPQIKTCLILADAVQFGNGKCPGYSKCVQEGAIRLNANTRRIPIKWEIFGSEREADQNATPRVYQSLSVAAALQGNPGAKERKRLVGILEERDPSHPFTSFVRDIPKFHSRQVLCGVDFAEGAGSDWDHTCKTPRINSLIEPQSTGRLTNEEISREIAGRTVVIGELNANDEHDSVIGADVPGVVLQANYIQSLLDGRYFPAISGWLSFLVYVVWFALTYWLFSNKRPAIAAACSIAVLITIIMSSFFAIRYFGQYCPWGLETAISLLAIIGVHWVHAKGHHTALENA